MDWRRTSPRPGVCRWIGGASSRAVLQCPLRGGGLAAAGCPVEGARLLLWPRQAWHAAARGAASELERFAYLFERVFMVGHSSVLSRVLRSACEAATIRRSSMCSKKLSPRPCLQFDIKWTEAPGVNVRSGAPTERLAGSWNEVRAGASRQLRSIRLAEKRGMAPRRGQTTAISWQLN